MEIELQRELRELRDIHEIQQAIHTYSIAIDSRQPELMLSVFTSDARVLIADQDEVSVRDYALGQKDFLHELEATQHAVSTHVIEVDGDRANSRCYFVAQHTRNSLGGDCLLLIGGHYDDEFVRQDGRWLIQKRIGTPTWMDGNLEVIGWKGRVGGLPWVERRNCPPWLEARLTAAPSRGA